MANRHHLKILKKGSSAWNTWRAKHFELYPDLSGANLQEANLGGADLFEANLYQANLSHRITCRLRETPLDLFERLYPFTTNVNHAHPNVQMVG